MRILFNKGKGFYIKLIFNMSKLSKIPWKIFQIDNFSISFYGQVNVKWYLLCHKNGVDTKQRLSKQRLLQNSDITKQRLLQNSDSYKTATVTKQRLKCYKTATTAKKNILIYSIQQKHYVFYFFNLFWYVKQK